VLTDEFVINLPTRELLEQVWAVGTRSGRNVDKFQATGLTPIPAVVVKPLRIAECPTHVECRIVDRVDTGDHTIFIGEVVANSCAVANDLTSAGFAGANAAFEIPRNLLLAEEFGR
jgi:flavin reductase (DIM6/NTAB) family NADH-FMN oxidoreductase RutF